jgi:hypothetical protein
MALTLPVGGGGGDFKRLPAGSHIAVCNLVADLGIQPGSGQYPDPKRQLLIRWEVPEERVEYEKDGQRMEGPQTISRTFTASMNEKAGLRKLLESWRGRKFSDEEAGAFDVSSILGKACLLSVSETTKGEHTYANVGNVSPLMKGMAAPKAENEPIYYGPDSPRTFEKLPKWVKEKIEKQLSPQTETSRDDRIADSFSDLDDLM